MESELFEVYLGHYQWLEMPSSHFSAVGFYHTYPFTVSNRAPLRRKRRVRDVTKFQVSIGDTATLSGYVCSADFVSERLADDAQNQDKGREDSNF